MCVRACVDVCTLILAANTSQKANLWNAFRGEIVKEAVAQLVKEAQGEARHRLIALAKEAALEE